MRFQRKAAGRCKRKGGQLEEGWCVLLEVECFSGDAFPLERGLQRFFWERSFCLVFLEKEILKVERERFERRGRIPWMTVRNSGVLEFELR